MTDRPSNRAFLGMGDIGRYLYSESQICDASWPKDQTHRSQYLSIALTHPIPNSCSMQCVLHSANDTCNECGVTGGSASEAIYLEQAVEDIGERKVGAQLLVLDLVLGLAQALCPEAHVPLPQLTLMPLLASAPDLSGRALHGETLLPLASAAAFSKNMLCAAPCH